MFRRSLYLDVTLSTQVVDLSWLHFVDDLHQTCAVSQIPIMQLHVCGKAVMFKKHRNSFGTV